jgi:fatty-acyl-CoA synthase
MPERPSYVHGTGSTPLAPDTVSDLLDLAAARWPEREALIVRQQGVRLGWRGLAEQVEKVAAGLLALGLEPGDRVGVLAPNCAEWVIAQFATARAGLVLVNLNPASRLGELEKALDAVQCRGLVSAARFKTSDYLSMLATLRPDLGDGSPPPAVPERLPALRHLVVIGGAPPPGGIAFEALAELADAPARRRAAEVASRLRFDDPVNIQFTSGTTGTPKAATLSHHAIVNNARLVGERMRLGPEDRVCIPVPMYHCFGMVLGTLVCVAHGATMVLPSAGFDARATLAAIAAERCTAVHGVPTMFIAELEDPELARFDLSSLRTGIMAGAPCPVELMQRLMRDMHLDQITIAYGMTETGPVSFQTDVDDPIALRVETVGRVLPHTEVKIVDPAGRAVRRGEPGELLTRGYCVMRGYWEDPERTATAIDAAGWMASGDLATLDADGYCRIVGRLKDMLIRGGENIYPREIEEVIYTHPAVDQVEVIGIPDPRYGEEICACVRLRRGVHCEEEEIREHCRARIAHFKVPRYVRFVDAFPTTVTGKVQKFRLRERISAELAGGRSAGEGAS